ncbi:hypothetical protein SAY87_016949 [Trapa incisa]|uniref:Uncharacterized protein n=1 Tax=Trapa incisa TaxID=236973 RepID=A0AAN7QZJ3_9MYRT|nr:hypothetical protein SAY87_016949 [Trapa incisa]
MLALIHCPSLPLLQYKSNPSLKVLVLNFLRPEIREQNMKVLNSIPLHALLVMQLFSGLALSQDFDFFYLVQQWPGSFCDTQKSCCYPTTGKPAADFGIHGLWPNYESGSYPSNCDPNNPFNPSETSDLKKSMQTNWPTLACPSNDGTEFWSHEWEKHGTCSESVLKQHDYFETALQLKAKVDLLGALKVAGVNPDGSSYSLKDIKDAIKAGTGYTPWIQCNTDPSGNSQLYQVYLCIDKTGSDLIECPVFPRGKCASEIEFPSF